MAESLVRRQRAVGERAIEAEKIGSPLAGQPGVAERLLRSMRIVLVAAAPVGDSVRERIPDVNQPCAVVGLLEQRQRPSRARLDLVDGRIVGEESAVVGGADTGECLGRLVPCRTRPLGCVGCERCCHFRGASEDRLAEIELEHDVQVRRTGQLQRPLEQPRRGPVVAAPEGAAAGGREPHSRLFRDCVVRLPELAPVAGGLLEVVAEDLVQLDQILSALFEPAREEARTARRGSGRAETRSSATTCEQTALRARAAGPRRRERAGCASLPPALPSGAYLPRRGCSSGRCS